MWVDWLGVKSTRDKKLKNYLPDFMKTKLTKWILSQLKKNVISQGYKSVSNLRVSFSYQYNWKKNQTNHIITNTKKLINQIKY